MSQSHNSDISKFEKQIEKKEKKKRRKMKITGSKTKDLPRIIRKKNEKKQKD